ncbi:hypothetical protein [Candidatus Neptunochlamydia vexilliferae]|uniref:Uncharacterized protein n=1 Tax=Candidatus Neptunichlamydia vexilliferae TaxID=1651774 RepID=A0ABS0AX35_9BACT|nr:hypothetical protein [Candidatus Neptunochlamydia vexilliferae]MBF5058700.1 hypothetical protein [Candidatus Neptunochlamydia vexilliferae]
MTFFPEPLRPSEGRKEEEIRVSPIEADKREEDRSYQEGFKNDCGLKTYVAFLMFLKKEIQGVALGKSSLLPEETEALRNLFRLLMDANQSENELFCGAFSEAWSRFLQNVQVLEHLPQKNRKTLKNLRELIEEVDNYPPNEDHKLGFYLSKQVGKAWLPTPFRQILRHLFTDHRLYGENSTLSRWVALLDNFY